MDKLKKHSYIVLPQFYILMTVVEIFFRKFYVAWDVIPYALMLLLSLVGTFFMTLLALGDKHDKSSCIKRALISTVVMGVVNEYGVPFVINNVFSDGKLNVLASNVSFVLCFIHMTVLLIMGVANQVGDKKKIYTVLAFAVGVVCVCGKYVSKAVAFVMVLFISFGNSNVTPVFGDGFVPAEKTAYDEGVFEMGEHDIYVVPAGGGNGAGTAESPVPLYVALNKLRNDRPDGDVTVWLGGGTYRLIETLRLDGIKNVTFRAVPGEKVYFSGGVNVTGWEKTSVNGVTAYVADFPVNDDGDYIKTLYNKSKRLSRPVYPDNGSLKVKDGSDKDGEFFSYCCSFYADVNDLVGFRNIGDVEVRVRHWWKDDLLPLHSVNLQTGLVETVKPSGMTIVTGNEFAFENVFEALNEPGEWYLDRTEQKLYYIPLPDDDMSTLVLRAGKVEELLKADGLENVSFVGIEFCDMGRQTHDGGTGADLSEFPEYVKFAPERSQAASDAVCAITVTNSKNVNFENCKFKKTGTSCLYFGEGTHDCSVISSEFADIGGNAVYITGCSDVETPELVTSNIKVVDCRINGYGKEYNNSIGVFIQHAKNCTVSHNEIHDGFYTGVSVGWNWGYTPHVTDGNLIEYNLIYDIGQGWLSDMGGIYTLGIQPGTVLRGNVIHNVGCDKGSTGYGGWGIYLDEGSSEILVENNLCYDCSSQGFHQHYGRDNMIVNNIFAMNGDGAFKISKKEDHNSLTVKNNIFAGGGTLTMLSVRRGQFTDDGNLYWNYDRGPNILCSRAEKPGIENDLSIAGMKLNGYFKHAVIADPLFKSVERRDFTLAENSPALDMGFVPFDFTLAGTRTLFE